MEQYKKKKNKLDARSPGERLYDFIRYGKLEDAKLLAADPNCNPNWASDVKETTPLAVASHRGYFDVVKILLRRQDLLANHQNFYGRSALIKASHGGSIKCVELLVDDPRTDVNLVREDGYSALWWAYFYTYVPIMKLLISHGANVEGNR